LWARLIAAGLLTAAVSGAAGPQAAALVQLLQNPGFESGASAWASTGYSAGCPAHSGSAALGLTPPGGGQQAIAQQQVEGVGAGSGPYSLSGVAKAEAGSPAGSARLRFLDGGGASLAEYQAALPLAGSYAAFEVEVPAAPPGSAALAVRFVVTGSGTACVDSLSLEGPAPATATPSPSATAPATATPMPTATASAAPQPSSTSTSPAATATPAPAATTPPPPTSTAAAAAQQAALVPVGSIANGGFEFGLAPWQKFGGELAVVAAPAYSGSAAGSFTSATSSTKWAYQVVRIAPGGVYEFSGHLLTGDGIAESYLRVSWYASADGSGRALGNSDSTARLGGGSAPYTALTTGPVRAPPGANSARLRVMLAPSGAASAVLYLDEMAFGPSAAPPPASAVVSTPTPEDDAIDDPAPASGIAPPVAPAGSPPAATTPQFLASSRSSGSGAGRAGAPLESEDAERESYSTSTAWVIAGVVFAVAGVGWAVWYTRKTKEATPP
jgi:hypothetical protein